jgi:hypothetical protein
MHPPARSERHRFVAHCQHTRELSYAIDARLSVRTRSGRVRAKPSSVAVLRRTGPALICPTSPTHLRTGGRTNEFTQKARAISQFDGYSHTALVAPSACR